MAAISATEWGFGRICASRAACLESAGTPDDLIQSLEEALDDACTLNSLNIAIDSKNNTFCDRRVIIQFQVAPKLYDWFFNARTGYRAQFWISPTNGMSFNEKIIASLKAVLKARLPDSVSVRRIKVIPESGSRTESDAGIDHITRDLILRSLDPAESKIWIGERIYDPQGVENINVGLAVLTDAAQSLEKLDVPRWAAAVNPDSGETGEGLRAPFPCAEYSWLDLKGGFLDPQGQIEQIKPQVPRACSIHVRGWT